jgi:hypothetical protein
MNSVGLEERSTHTMAVVNKCTKLRTGLSPEQAIILDVAACYHDIGYFLGSTVHHNISGYRLVKELGFPTIVAELVYAHSFGDMSLEMQNLPYDDMREIREQDSPLFQALLDRLNYADATCGPEGQNMTLQERVDDIAKRYGTDSMAHKFAQTIFPILVDIEKRLKAEGVISSDEEE